MSKDEFQLQQGEEELGSWTIYYEPTNYDVSFTGRLTITNQRVIYFTQGQTRYSWGRKMRNMGDDNLLAELLRLDKQFFTYDQKTLSLIIPRDKIKKVDSSKKLLSKKVIITLADNSHVTFSYGAMNIDKILEALKS
ncbi:PH domain-containing protein [Patescibacteria group bacterium]